jgi:hypothetical protein
MKFLITLFITFFIILFVFAGVASAQTTVVLNGTSYTLQSHPRVMLDGPSGALTLALQNTSDRANSSNPAYVGLQTQANNYVTRGYLNPMTDYFNFSDAGGTDAYPGANTLACATMWWAQGGPSQSPIDPHGYLACAEYGINNAIRLVGNSTSCVTTFTYCGPTVNNGRTADLDYTRQYLVYYAQAYSIIRSQLTSGQRQAFANVMLNDWTPSQGGIDTEACTPQPITFGTGTLSTSGSSANVTITGGTTAQLAVGDIIFNNNSNSVSANSYLNSPAAVVTGITNSSTFTVNPPVSIPPALSFPLEFSAPWTTGNCGIIWFVKHHGASPPIAANYSYPFGGGAYADLNLNMTALLGYIAIGLALADDDPRAVTLLQQAYNYYYVNMYPYMLSADTGFGSSGNAYSNARTHQFKHKIAWMIQKSVLSGPNLFGQYLYREIPFEFMGMIPNFAQDVMTFQQNNANKWNEGSGAIATLYTIAGMDSSDPNTPYLNYYLMTKRGDYNATTFGSASWTDPVIHAYMFMDPQATQTNITGFPLQYLFNDTQYSTCVSLGLTCWPNMAYGHVISRSGWSSTDDVAMLEAGWTNGSDHSSSVAGVGNGNWGDFRIYRNNAYLLGSDDGWQADAANSPENMNMIELGGGNNWAQTGATLPDSYCGGGRSYTGTYGGCNAPILRWASTDPTGDSGNRYMYVMTDMKNVYDPSLVTTAPVRVQRHIMHFKKATYQDYFVVYDDVQTGAGTTIAALWQYSLCPWSASGGTFQMNNAGCQTPASVITFNGSAGTVTETQASALLNSTFLYPGGNGVLLNQSNTYTGHAGLTNRIYSCNGSGSACSTTATTFEEIVVHQPVNGTSGTMPTITSPTCTGTGGNCAVTQIADSGYPKVAVFARQGALLTGASFTTTHGGTAQYLVAGLSPGTYQVGLNGSTILSNQTVATGDNTLYFESSSGSMAVTQTAGAPGDPVLSCDLIGNGVVNVQDVQISVNAALGLIACLPQYQLDGSGTCTVIDVQRVANAVLGLGCRIGP